MDVAKGPVQYGGRKRSGERGGVDQPAKAFDLVSLEQIVAVIAYLAEPSDYRPVKFAVAMRAREQRLQRLQFEYLR